MVRQRHIQAHEFLFLLSNSINREKAVLERLPKALFTREIDQKNGTVKMDEGLSMTRAPDKWLSHIIMQTLDKDKIYFEGQPRRKLKNFRFKNDNGQTKVKRNNQDQLQQLMKSPDFFKELKTELKSSNTTVALSKINKLDYKNLPSQKPLMKRVQTARIQSRSSVKQYKKVKASKFTISEQAKNSIELLRSTQKLIKQSSPMQQTYTKQDLEISPFNIFEVKTRPSTRPTSRYRNYWEAVTSRPITAGTGQSTAFSNTQYDKLKRPKSANKPRWKI